LKIMRTVKVRQTNMYRDGGTKELTDKDGNVYYQDFGIFSPTRGKIYDKYPGDKNAKILDIKVEIENN